MPDPTEPSDAVGAELCALTATEMARLSRDRKLSLASSSRRSTDLHLI